MVTTRTQRATEKVRRIEAALYATGTLTADERWELSMRLSAARADLARAIGAGRNWTSDAALATPEEDE